MTLADDGEHDEDQGAGEGQRAEHRVEEVDEGQIDRHPGQVEQRRGALAAEETAHRVDVAPALQRLGGGEAEARHVDGDAVRQGRDLAVDTGADPHQHLGADDVEGALEQIEPDRQRRQHHQGRNAAAGQGAVVDLHHVDGAGERQHVDHAGDHEQKQDDAAEALGQFGQALALRGGELFRFGHFSGCRLVGGKRKGRNGRNISRSGGGRG